MALPILNTPEFETTVPSTNQKIKFRPFLVKEEKILFMALQGNDPAEMSTAVQRVLESCIITPNIDVHAFATFDLEYLFLKLRGKSVGEVIDLKLRHKQGDCNYVHAHSINIDDINVVFPDDTDKKVQITDNVGIVLKYPSIDLASMVPETNDMDSLFKLIAGCVDVVYDSDNVYEDFSQEEIQTFLESLNGPQFAKIRDFFKRVPKLSHDIEWTCPKCEQSEKIHLEGLASFFM
jgi:hypothetical protein